VQAALAGSPPRLLASPHAPHVAGCGLHRCRHVLGPSRSRGKEVQMPAAEEQISNHNREVVSDDTGAPRAKRR
jgi:hypothetical protein